MSTHEPRNKSKSADDARARVKEVASVSQALLGRAKKRGPLRRGRKAIDPHGAPHVVDVHVGTQLKKLRVRRQLSQQALAELLDLTFQQIQKYEGGKNRLSASRMYEISRHLQVTPSYFFEGIDPKLDKAITGNANVLQEDPIQYLPENDFMTKTESIRMMAAFYRIENPEVRVALRMLVYRVAQSYDPEVEDFEEPTS